jgi:RNA polymerase sigma factor (sigma-70 family)
MSKRAVQSLRHYLRQASDQAALPTDAQLLRQFIDANDQRAFEMLLERHGPMVLGTARRLVNNAADAADVFQAVFLSLARLAKSIRQGQSVPNWLYTTTCRIAVRARKRRVVSIENAPEPSTSTTAETDLAWREVRTALDEELQRLPERLRLPLLLCYLSGLTRDEAADQLGWSLSTLKRRLEDGRVALRGRLERRGISAAGLALAVLSPAALDAAVGPALTKSCLDAVSGNEVAAGVSALILTTTTTIKGIAMKAVIVSLALVGLGLGIHASFGRADAPAPADEKKADEPKAAAKDSPPAPKAEPTAARKLLDRLQELKKGQALNDDSAAVLRDLINLGPAAVPDVIAELDATTDPFMLRCLGFAARGIGDKRVVPALIRALPKACQTGASDYGLQIRSGDAQLLAFMQAHSQRMRVGGGKFYSFGRPITEFRSALQRLTGANHGEDELNNVFLDGSARQQYLQRDLYRQCAERWAAWWEKNAKQFVDDPRYATVGLPPRPPVVAVPAAAEFPRGPRTEVRLGRVGGLLESARTKGAKCVFLDLDTGRSATLPEKFRVAAGKPERLDDIIAWAEEEGYDLMGTEYTPPGGGEPHFVIRGLGLTAWQIDAGRRRNLEEEIKADKPLEMGKQVSGGLLATFDAAAGKYKPEETGLFLFRTREGGFGWIFVGVEVRDDTQPNPLGVGAPRADPELSPAGPAKGRRFAYTLAWEGAKEPGGKNKDAQRPEVPKSGPAPPKVSAPPKEKAPARAEEPAPKNDAPKKEPEPLTLKGHTSEVLTVCFSPDGKRIVTGGGVSPRPGNPAAPGEVKVWDAAKGTEMLALNEHTARVTSVCFSPDGKRIASAGADETVRVWDAANGKEIFTLKDQTRGVGSVCFSPDGKRLATLAATHIKVWDAEKGEELLTLQATGRPTGSVCFSPDGKRLASLYPCNSGGRLVPGEIKVWDVEKGVELLSLKGHTGFVFSVAFSPDGKRLASAGEDQVVRVWDAENGKELLTLKGHTAVVCGASFSPDGKHIATASWDQTVKVWDAAKGQLLITLTGHTGLLRSVCFSPDGKRLASASMDQTVKVWVVDREK